MSFHWRTIAPFARVRRTRSSQRRTSKGRALERLEERWVPATLTYNNGPLLANVQLQAVYYAPWDTNATLVSQRATLNAYLASLAGGTYIPSLLSQYSVTSPTAYTIGAGSNLAPDATFPTPTLSSATINGTTYNNVITDTSIRNTLTAELTANDLTNNANTLYVVFTPPGDPIVSGTQNSIQNFFAYHWNFTTGGKNVYYAVMPYPGSPNGTYNPLTTVQLLEEAASHEVAESITDPSTGTGWFQSALSTSGEVGDLANISYSTLNGYVVQNEFSNVTNAAAVATGTSFYVNSFSNPYNGQFNGVIGSFVDTSGSGSLSYASINWGDGTPSDTNLTVQRTGPTTFDLIGTHDYTGAIGTQYNLNIWLTLADGSQAHSYGQIGITDTSNVNHVFNDLGLVTLQDAPLTPVNVPTLSGTEGQTLTNGLLGAFTDPGGDGTTTAYTATITWDDGAGNSHTSTGRVSFVSGTTYDVYGDNTVSYAEEGVHNIQVVVNDSGGATTTLNNTVSVIDPPVVATGGFNLTALEGAPVGSQVVATFTDPGGAEPLTDYSATIDWGNGAVTGATISGPVGGVFSVLASGNVYGEEDTVNGSNSYGIMVTIFHESTAPQTVASTSTVIDPAVVPSAGIALPSTKQGVPTGLVTLATFTDPGGAEPNSFDPGPKISDHYAASINWGDGSTAKYGASVGHISESGGIFTITNAGHLYLAPGTYPVTVTITHEATAPQVVNDTILVTEQDLIGVIGQSLTGNPGQPLSHVEVATFSDGYPYTDAGTPTTAANYTASIDWGDGTTTTGSIGTAGAGVYGVTGSHTYTHPGPYVPIVTVSKNGEPSDVGTGDASVFINPTVVTPAGVTVTATEGVTYNGPVATISTNDWTLQASNFSASITWGTGATLVGTVTGSNGSFTVTGAYTYAEEQSRLVAVKVLDNLPGAGGPLVVPVLSTVNVLEGDVLTPHGRSLTATTGTALSGVLATFSDTYTSALPSGFTASVNWGDGAITPGTVGGGSGTLTVSGAHTYAKAKSYAVTIVLVDVAPGMASASATSSVIVTQAPLSLARSSSSGFVVVATSPPSSALIDQGGSQTSSSRRKGS